MSMTKISKGDKTHYASFSENYFVVDDIFLFKKVITAQRTEGWAIINEIVSGKIA